jgi:hypothetical protein
MEIIKISEHKYSIVYVNNNEEYNIYRRYSEDKWEVLYKEQWNNVEYTTELEKLYNERINGNRHEQK